MKFGLYFFSILILIFSCKNKNSKSKYSIEKHSSSIISSDTIVRHKIVPTVSEHTGWIELKSLDTTFVYDIRYATNNNFVHKKMYGCAKCFLRKEVAFHLLEIQKELSKKGMRLKLFDCYRPGKVQKELWKIMPNPSYVANPKKGSMHNRGLAVDLTIVGANGEELNMGTGFDFFGKQAYHSYTNFPAIVLKNRVFLKGIMEKYGFKSITSEWWHYSYRKKSYPIAQWLWNCD